MNKCNSSEVKVTLFVNPHLFWLFYYDDQKKRDFLENELRKTDHNPLQIVDEQQMVLIYDGNWKRAIVKSENTVYSCWLPDYGVMYEAKTVYEIPDSFKVVSPLTRQAALDNVICIKKELDATDIQITKDIYFNAGVIKQAKDFVENAKGTFFCCLREIEGVHIGSLTLWNSTGLSDLTTLLTKAELITEDKDFFLNALKINTEEHQFNRTASPCPSIISQNRLSTLEDIIHMQGIGRGTKSKSDVREVNTCKKFFMIKWLQAAKAKEGEAKICSRLSSNSDNQFEDVEQSYEELDSFSDDSKDIQKSDESLVNEEIKLKSSHVLKEISNSYAASDTGLEYKGKDKYLAQLNDLPQPPNCEVHKSNGSKRSSKIVWADFRDTDESAFKSSQHLNIAPAGSIFSNCKKTSKPKEERAENSETSYDDVLVSMRKEIDTNKMENALNNLKINNATCKCKNCDSFTRYCISNVEHADTLQKMKRKPKQITKPSPLLKKVDVKIETNHFQSIPSSSCSKMSSIDPKLLVHGWCIPTPVTTTSTLPFHPVVYKVLSSFEQVFSIQSYVWPLLTRSMNVCVVAPPKSGKTMSYLPVMCTNALEKNERYNYFNRNNVSPLIIILCPGSKIVQKVYESLMKVLGNNLKDVSVAIAIPPLDKKCLSQFQKTSDVIVTTPLSLISLLRSRIINLKRLCHLVIENCDVLLKKHAVPLENILLLAQSVLDHRNANYQIQVVVTAESWTVPLENLLKRMHIVPVVCISSYLEAALYGRVDLQMHFLEKDIKTSTLANILKTKFNILRTIILCNKNEELQDIEEVLRNSGIKTSIIKDDMDETDINDAENYWKSSIDGKHYVLVCTDLVFNRSITIRDAVVLIHYSLPYSWSQFKNRFGCLTNSYISPFITEKTDDLTRCKSHVFVDESCTKQFPKLVQFLNRMGAKLSDGIQTYYKQKMKDFEMEKIKSKHKLCKNIEIFGCCSIPNCVERHLLSTTLDFNNNLPKNGLIKFQIINVHDVTKFKIQLLEYSHTNGKMVKYDGYETLNEHLQIVMEKNKKCVLDVKPGNSYVLHLLDKKCYRRCCVQQILSVLSVAVYLYETDEQLNVAVSFLYEMPPQFADIPPQAVNAYLANAVPPELDEHFSSNSKTKLLALLEEADYKNTDTYMIGRIVLQLGNTFWLNNIKVLQDLASMETIVTRLNLRKALVDQHLCEISEEPLKEQYKLCATCGITLPTYELPKSIQEVVKKTAKTQIQGQWAHFPEEDCNEVYIASIVSPSLFYVRIKKFYDLLEKLQKDIQEAILKPFYPTEFSVLVGYYYLAKDPEGDEYCRVQVVESYENIVEIFFVDYGDSARIDKSELRYLSDEFILRLPFQVIECELFGVQSLWDEWEESSTNMLYEYVFEPNTDYYRTLYTTSCKEEQAVSTGGTRHKILLVDNFKNKIIIINKLLIDSGEAINIKGEDIDAQFSIPDKYTECEEEENVNIEMSKEFTIKEINELQEQYKTQEDEEHNSMCDQDYSWDIEIDDPEMFMKQLLGTPTSAVKHENKQREIDLPPIRNALPLSNYLTPNVRWHQTDTCIKLNIAIPNVQNYKIQLVRGFMFMFSTLSNNKEYRLNLQFFDKLHKTYQHSATGFNLKVTFTKVILTEWPRLTSSTEKTRYIKYDIDQCVLPDEKPKLFLNLGKDENEENDDDQKCCIYEYGSDEDYNESDPESVVSG